MKTQFSRSELMFGSSITEVLKNKKVAVIGVGGVGGMAIECLVRMGIGNILVYDHDTIDITNLNRQIFTTMATVEHAKGDVIKDRIKSINPECNVTICNEMFSINSAKTLHHYDPDFIIDAADTIKYKIELIEFATQNKFKFITSLGMANKFDPARVVITQLSKTSYDPIARILRKKMKELHINIPITVVFSDENPIKPHEHSLIGDQLSDIRKKKMPPSSNVFVPNQAGLLAAHYVINSFLKEHNIIE